MSNGMCCSASHCIASASSLSRMRGRRIVLVSTACPDTATAVSAVLIFSMRSRLRSAVTTLPSSVMV